MVENGEVKNIYDGFPLLKERKSSIPLFLQRRIYFIAVTQNLLKKMCRISRNLFLSLWNKNKKKAKDKSSQITEYSSNILAWHLATQDVSRLISACKFVLNPYIFIADDITCKVSDGQGRIYFEDDRICVTDQFICCEEAEQSKRKCVSYMFFLIASVISFKDNLT